VDLGGGFGISYNKKDKQINLNNYAKFVYDFKKKLNCNIIFEPGRSLIGNTGILVSKIQYIKKGSNKNFVIIDAGMNDFMRTALYDVSHDIVPIIKTKKQGKEPVEFVGPICETSCKFAKYKKYQKIKEGDFVAITHVGAYGSSLSSNYNTKPLIAEILTSKKKFKIIRKKQDLLKLINS
jgi:diaminopimelate decarboxylase